MVIHFGLGERGSASYALRHQIGDLKAVVLALGLDSFALLARQASGPAALSYIADFPGQVSHLVLWHSFAKGKDFFSLPPIRALLCLLDRDWERFTEGFAAMASAWSSQAEARRAADSLRAWLTPDLVRSMASTVIKLDASQVLRSISTPTLIVYRSGFLAPFYDDLAWKLAAEIPNAQLATLPGSRGNALSPESDVLFRAIEEFLSESRADHTEERSQGLSIREREILELMASGRSNDEIARELVLTVGTAKTHIHHIFWKLNVRNRVTAVVVARRVGLLLV